MNLPRLFYYCSLVLLAITIFCVEVHTAGPQSDPNNPPAGLTILPSSLAGRVIEHPPAESENTAAVREWTVATPTDGGIKEEVPLRFRERFRKWKAELLGTASGKAQWDRYANDKGFVLRVVVSTERKRGASTDRFLWNDSGNLVGATIVLGAKLDEGYPNPIYYPVLNALASNGQYRISGEVLAASKLSHEISHVEQAAASKMASLRLRELLIPQYKSIFRENGWNINDEVLIGLADRMGGTPVQISEDREYRSEANLMQYLKERLSKESFYCFVFSKIRLNVETYALGYKGYFALKDFGDSGACRTD